MYIKINSYENLFVESLRYSNCGYIIAEEFVEGDEYTAEGFASDYKHRTMAISKKKHFRLAIASSLEYPAQLSAEEKKKLVTFNDLFSRSFYIFCYAKKYDVFLRFWAKMIKNDDEFDVVVCVVIFRIGYQLSLHLGLLMILIGFIENTRNIA